MAEARENVHRDERGNVRNREAGGDYYREDEVVVRRISWGAIFAGVIIVLITHVTLTMLGLAVGFASIDPVSEQDPMWGFAVGEMIWWVISALISVFLGAWAASRLSGLMTGILHGIVTWGLVEIIFIIMLTTAVGTIIGGALGLVESGITAAAKAAPEIAGAIDLPEGVDIPVQQIQDEIKKLLKETEAEGLQPEQLEQEAEQAAETARQAAGEAVRQPTQAYDEIMQAVKKLLAQAEGVASDVDKEAVVNVLVERTDMSREEAGKTVDKWIKAYNEASKEVRQTAKEFKKEAVQTIEEAGEATAEAISSAAWWSFVMLVLTAIAAAAGGFMGLRFPKDTAAKK